MKKIFYILLSYLLIIENTLATEVGDTGILGGEGITETKIRNGDIHTSDIPNILRSVIDFLMGIAGTIAIIFVIVGAYQILFGSIANDQTKGKNTIIMALTGFTLAALSWFIIKLIIDNFS